jgi:hypothetical protein
MATTCPTCGHTKRATKTTARKASRTITMGGKTWPGQRAAYDLSMRVKRGDLVWCVLEHADRFGARGDFVTPERAAELRAKQAERIENPPPRSRIEELLDSEAEGRDVDWRRPRIVAPRPRTLIAAAVLAQTVTS